MKKAYTWGVCVVAFLLSSCASDGRSSIYDLRIGMTIAQVRGLVTMSYVQGTDSEEGEHDMFYLVSNQRQVQAEAKTYTYLYFTNGKYVGLMTYSKRQGHQLKEN